MVIEMNEFSYFFPDFSFSSINYLVILFSNAYHELWPSPTKTISFLHFLNFDLFVEIQKHKREMKNEPLHNEQSLDAQFKTKFTKHCQNFNWIRPTEIRFGSLSFSWVFICIHTYSLFPHDSHFTYEMQTNMIQKSRLCESCWILCTVREHKNSHIHCTSIAHTHGCRLWVGLLSSVSNVTKTIMYAFVEPFRLWVVTCMSTFNI